MGRECHEVDEVGLGRRAKLQVCLEEFLGIKSGILDAKCSSLVQSQITDTLCGSRSSGGGARRDDRSDGRSWKGRSDSRRVSSDRSDGLCWMHEVESFESDSASERLGGGSWK